MKLHLLLLVTTSLMFAQSPSKSPTFQGALSGDFMELRKVSDLPIEIREALPSSGIGMCDPGGRFSEGCIVEPGVSTMRMIFAGSSMPFIILGWERGGRAYNRNLEVYEIKRGKAVLIRSYNLPKNCASLKSALVGIRNGSIQLANMNP